MEYSMLFSPGASSFASTPGGGIAGNNNNNNNSNHTDMPPPSSSHAAPNNNNNNNNNNIMMQQHHQNQQHQQQQQQQQELNWDPNRVKTELLKATAILSHRCLKLASKWAAEQVSGIPVGDANPVINGSGGDGGDSNGNNNNNNNDINGVDLSFNTNDCSIEQQEEDPSMSMIHELSDMNAEDWYAKSLFELGEFLHAASILSSSSPSNNSNNNNNNNNNNKDITQMGPPKEGLSAYGFYLRAYALFMAGERRKEEEYNELESSGTGLGGGGGGSGSHNNDGSGGSGGGTKTTSVGGGSGGVSSATTTRIKNPYLSQLVREVSEAYNDNNELGLSGGEEQQQQQQQPRYTLDAFGLYVYGMLLKEAKNESIPCPHPPHMILVESLLEFPLNWSAWLDLCEVLTSGNNDASSASMTNSNIEQQVEQTLQPILATHYMYHFFCAHLMAHHHSAHEDALVLLERLYEPLPDQPLFQSPHLKTQLAVVHYHLRELEQALMWFKESSADDRYSLDHKDVYSNILYVKEDRVALSHLAHEAVVIDKYRPETCCIVGNYYSLKQQRQKAVLYFQRALKLDRSYTSAWTLMGHEYVELKQTEQAMESYRRAVTVSPKDYRAWYGLGQTYEFLNMYLYALFYYRKAATLRPYDPRMWCAVGQCFSALHKIQDAIRAYERAVAQEDNEGIATQKLAALYRQDGRQEEAAMCYIRHLELRYLVTSASPEHQQQNGGTAAATPTLDAIVQGIVLESVEAEALLFLAQYHKSHGEFDTAALMCSRLVEYPGPEKEQAKGLLRDLRSRGRRYPTRSSTAAASVERGTTPVGGSGRATSNQSPFQFSP
jgi:anaphase-promoting complex subunit 8